MPSGLFGWPTLLILLVVILLVFGSTKLPALAKSMGESARAFKGEMRAMKDEDAAEAAARNEAAKQAPDSTAPDTDTPDQKT